jgi:hypothetical protein
LRPVGQVDYALFSNLANINAALRGGLSRSWHAVLSISKAVQDLGYPCCAFGFTEWHHEATPIRNGAPGVSDDRGKRCRRHTPRQMRRADAVGFLPAYTFETPVLGGQLTVGAAGVPGNVGVNIGATLTRPRGNQISGNAHDERPTFADVYYLATLKWNQGVNNFMWYVLGNIPSGTYDSTRLANLSPGYTAVDSGVGYTYLNPQTGHELSAVAGFTYNGMNDALQYRNGIDFHFDWAVSQFVSKSVLVGIAGYVYQQITGYSGAGAKLGDFKGHSVGIGPQIGIFFPAFEG